MDSTESIYDLVICADVLVYLGDLTDFFKALKKIILKGSWVSFSVESSNNSSYELKPSKRFGHSADYIKNLAIIYDFNLIDLRPDIIRYEAGIEIQGYIILLKFS
jgi:predicted TPR repeat methyltransferase